LRTQTTLHDDYGLTFGPLSNSLLVVDGEMLIEYDWHQYDHYEIVEGFYYL